MPKPRPPFLRREITRHGKAVWYFRRDRNGKRLRLPGEFGSKEFTDAYAAALSGIALDASVLKPKGGTLEWLIERHRHSSAWAKLKPATRRQRENIFLHICKTAGRIPFKAITAKKIREGRELRKDRPAAANNFLKTMRALFAWAAEEEFIATNPAADVEFLSAKTEGHEPWTLDDVAQFERRWPAGTRERVAMHVLLYTGLRRGDACRLGRQHIRDSVARLKTEKTGEELFIPIRPELAKTLAAGPTGDLAFIVSEKNRPYTKESFGNWFGDACRAAGLVRKSAHGLRKTLATDAANAGASELELQAFFGWTNSRTSSIYTRKAARERLAKQAGEKLNRNDDATGLRLTPKPGAARAGANSLKSKTGK